MNTRLRTVLLLVITLALAFAPLRGALAMAAASTADSDSHCAEMMHSMPSSDNTSAPQQTVKLDSMTEDCCNQCDGSCADSNCADCVNTTIAISNTASVHPGSLNTPPTLPLLVTFPPGNFAPPFRPPVSI